MYSDDDDNSSNIEDVNKLVEKIADAIPNVHFLNRKSVIFDRVRFLGCTLWTKSNRRLARAMNDYYRIPGMTPDVCEELHKRDVTWLSEQFDVAKSGNGIESEFEQTVVITHHLPSYKLIADKYQGDSMNSLFATNLEDLVAKADIWCSGHSHCANQVKIGKCRCYLNPTGYPGEITGFNPFIEIPLKS